MPRSPRYPFARQTTREIGVAVNPPKRNPFRTVLRLEECEYRHAAGALMGAIEEAVSVGASFGNDFSASPNAMLSVLPDKIAFPPA